MSLKTHICHMMAAVLCCTACHKDDGQPEKKTEDQKVLRLYLQSEPMSMDPRIGGNRVSQVVLREVFEGMMRIDSQGRPSFAAAESVDVSDDKRTYRFHLRPTLWSNGTPVTADDFAFAWKSMLSPDAPTAFSYAFFCIKNARKANLGLVSLDEVGIHVEDARTLVVTLENPVPYFIELTSNPLYSPVCKAVVESNPNWSHEAGPDFVSNGPFVLSDWKHRNQLTLAKNDYYWDAGTVSTQKMTFPIIENPQTALQMYEAGELHWAGDPFGDIPIDAIPHLKAEKKLQLRQIGSANWLEVNVNHPLLSSTKIRNALAMAINRQEIADHLLQGGEKPAYTIVPETLTLLQKPTFKDNDQELARALFKEGLEELHLTPQTLPQVTFAHTSEPIHKALAEAIQQQWVKSLGFQVQLNAADRNSHLARVSRGEFDIASLTWYTFFHDPIYNLELLKYCTGSHNYNGTHWENPYYTELLNQSDLESNPAARDDILRQAEGFLMQEMPVIPICYNTTKFVKNDAIFGESLSPIGMIELKNIDIDAVLATHE